MKLRLLGLFSNLFAGKELSPRMSFQVSAISDPRLPRISRQHTNRSMMLEFVSAGETTPLDKWVVSVAERQLP